MHNSECSCNDCNKNASTSSQNEVHIKLRENSRRDFLKTAGGVGFGLAGAMMPFSASALKNIDSSLQSREMFENKAVKKGKADVVTILHTADIHGQLLIHDEFFIEDHRPVYRKRGGYATLKTMIKALRAENTGKTFFIDGGDCFQGSGVAALSKGKAIVPLMNNLNYDLMLPGNWEVIYGKKIMMEDMLAYNAGKVCANMFHDTNDSRNDTLIFPPYFVKSIGAGRIGFVGYNDPLTAVRQSPAYSKGIRFAHPEKNIAKYIEILRKEEKCNVVIILTHMGLAQQIGLADMPYVKGADYILGADTHERVREPLQRKYARVTESGAFASFVAKLDIAIEKGVIREQSYQLLDVDPERYEEDEEMKLLVDQMREPYKEKVDRVIGTTKVPLVRYYVLETPMDNFITDAIMWKFNPDIALSNGFRFCPPLIPDTGTGVANITVDYLWSMIPDDSDAKQGIITGNQLWQYMETELHNAFARDPARRVGGWLVRFKGMEINFTINKQKGKRVNWIRVKGKPLVREKHYTVVACERDGDPETTICRLNHMRQPKRLGISLHKVIEEYLESHSPVAPQVEGRATATDAPATLLTQISGIGYEFR